MRPSPDSRNRAEVASKNDLPAFTGEYLVDYCVGNDLWVEDLLCMLVSTLSLRYRGATHEYSGPLKVVLKGLDHRRCSVRGVHDRELDLWRFVHDPHFLLEPLMQAHYCCFSVAIWDEARRANE